MMSANSPQARPPPKKSRMASPAPRSGHPSRRIESLLRDLGPDLVSGEALRRLRIERELGGRPLFYPSGLDAIDKLLGGGFRRGQISEISGSPSSGRTSLLLTLLAHTTTHNEEFVALVDRANAFDPASAEMAGVDLQRVLWVRVADPHPEERRERRQNQRQALRCTEHLLETDGLPLVVLDLDSSPSPPPHHPPPGPGLPTSAWIRLARLAASTETALIVLSRRHQTGSQARLVLEMQPTHPHFRGSPPLLEEIETRAVLIRHERGAANRSALIRLGAPPSPLPHSPPAPPAPPG